MEVKSAAKSHYILTLTPECDSFTIICAINIKQSDPNVKKNSPRAFASDKDE